MRRRERDVRTADGHGARERHARKVLRGRHQKTSFFELSRLRVHVFKGSSSAKCKSAAPHSNALPVAVLAARKTASGSRRTLTPSHGYAASFASGRPIAAAVWRTWTHQTCSSEGMEAGFTLSAWLKFGDTSASRVCNRRSRSRSRTTAAASSCTRGSRRLPVRLLRPDGEPSAASGKLLRALGWDGKFQCGGAWSTRSCRALLRT